MKGNIYTSEKCIVCGGVLTHDENRCGCFCKEHPQVCATSKFKVAFGREITRRFKDYKDAQQFLLGLRHETTNESFDARDYKESAPLGFQTVATKWLRIKKKATKHGQYRNLARYMADAGMVWGQRNIKTIKFAALEDFLYHDLDDIKDKPLSDKSRHNYCSALHDMFSWVCDREEDIPMPKFPKIEYELGTRNIISIEDQTRVMDEVRRLTYDLNPRVWLGIKWLCTYGGIRPGELRDLKERNIDVNGYFFIPDPKEKQPKLIMMRPDDLKLYHSMPKGLPDLYFFRHEKGNGSAKPGQQFGKDYLYNKWKAACKNLGITGVDLYGGTRHSSASEMGKHFPIQTVMDAFTIHKTNRAGQRYIQSHHDQSVEVYEKLEEVRASKVIPFKKSG